MQRLWKVVIGIETHAQIKSRRKLFSPSLSSRPVDPQNSKVSPFDAAFPGTLPNLNPKCVDLALRTAIALNADIQRRSSFDRKHYFYSDLPAGYQITQQYAPIAKNGYLNIYMPNSQKPIQIGIKQIQLEQDTAKSTSHPRNLTSYIDLNRANTPLMEIVSLPDLHSPEEAGVYVKTLQALLRAIGASDGNMEQGSIRCDVNVSVSRIGEPSGTRCEIKNLNSIKFMMAAINHEVTRQIALLTTPPFNVPQETRGFDEDTFETFKLRSKEDAPDYRYMPDPNLGVLVLSESRISTIAQTVPELPWVTKERLITGYGLTEKQADIIMKVDAGTEVGWDGEDLVREEPSKLGAIRYFDALCQSQEKRDPNFAHNWMTQELLGQLAARKETFADNTLSVQQFGQLIDLVQNKSLTGTSAKYLLRHMLANPSGTPTREIAKEMHMMAFSSSSSSPSSPSLLIDSSSHSPSPVSTTTSLSTLDSLISRAFLNLPSEVASLRAGNNNVLNKIVGWIMRESRGRADARLVREEVRRRVVGEGGAKQVE